MKQLVPPYNVTINYFNDNEGIQKTIIRVNGNVKDDDGATFHDQQPKEYTLKKIYDGFKTLAEIAADLGKDPKQWANDEVLKKANKVM